MPENPEKVALEFLESVLHRHIKLLMVYNTPDSAYHYTSLLMALGRAREATLDAIHGRKYLNSDDSQNLRVVAENLDAVPF